ncbi:MAG: hypothetical protein LBR66_04400, partial [Candidatus Symbiothrix sp.]|nr:hypothetical protein [Candidatus Symbiothrix sp.]
MRKKYLLSNIWAASIALVAATAAFTSCEKDDNSEKTEQRGAFLLSVTGESAEYLLQTDDLVSGTLSIADNKKQLEQAGYTWIFNAEPSMAVGLIYQQGDPG